ncbi:unnamed protein product [Mytilus coruscus]|uniref:Uncharacterized protein n=1 Tax=Mytilus coruscus TaxID=42192 RepID=A0A6J8EWN2_MYTCO|nr:unnamed protein product [Mytilus coruscus]
MENVPNSCKDEHIRSHPVGIIKLEFLEPSQVFGKQRKRQHIVYANNVYADNKPSSPIVIDTDFDSDSMQPPSHNNLNWACDSEGNDWVLGLRDIETKSANDTLKVFNQILSDLDDASRLDDNYTSRSIVSHIVATMSDRAATELKFNNLLSDFRKETLPLAIENHDDFTDDENKSMENLCNFFLWAACLNMNDKYLELILFLDDSSKNIRSFMRGELLPFGHDTYIERDPTFDALLQSDIYDDTVDMTLQVPSFLEWFNVVYDEDPAVYTYHHLDTEIRGPDIIILI